MKYCNKFKVLLTIIVAAITQLITASSYAQITPELDSPIEQDCQELLAQCLELNDWCQELSIQCHSNPFHKLNGQCQLKNLICGAATSICQQAADCFQLAPPTVIPGIMPLLLQPPGHAITGIGVQ